MGVGRYMGSRLPRRRNGNGEDEIVASTPGFEYRKGGIARPF